MADGGDAHRGAVVDHLVEHPVRAHSQRPDSPQTPVQIVTSFGVSFEHTEGVNDAVGERPLEVEEFLTSASGENDARHRSPTPATLAQLGPQLLERHDLTAG